MTAVEPLSAPIELQFDYTRSLGPTLGGFLTGLARRQVRGVRTADGTVIVPPLEYDPKTHQALTDFVDVSDRGEVLTWSWAAEPLPGQPLDRPFAWALVKLDGADTGLLHALDVPSPDAVHTGMRVQARWAAQPVGHIRDIVCFEQETDAAPTDALPAGDDVTMVTTPVGLRVQHSASIQETRYLKGLKEGKLLGQRCPQCGKVYIPPRGACPVDGVPTEEEVELPDRGTVTTFCIVNVPFLGQKIKPPYVAAYVLLDGADIAFLHLILDCPAEDVRMGLRVEAVWKPREEWEFGLQNITHFRPSGEPDASYDSFKEHL
ncbi:MAG: Zn-ribbon domain-containing OB-fold protein [Jatrophihabitans sp.]|uniref:Zn-ribbon domain-containing OB-fold protein n=1 Tax=Jatrophihabitans sp. TaxID=1932789 RepID=UPI00391626A5